MCFNHLVSSSANLAKEPFHAFTEITKLLLPIHLLVIEPSKALIHSIDSVNGDGVQLNSPLNTVLPFLVTDCSFLFTLESFWTMVFQV